MSWAYRASSYADDGAGFNINNPTGGTAPTFQLGVAAVAADRIIVNVIAGANSGQTPTLALSDSINGSYVQDATQTWTDSGVGVRHSVFSKANVAAGRPTFTLTVSGTTSGQQFGGIQAAAYSGLDTATGIDVSGAGQASSTSASATTGTTTGGAELIIGAYTDLGYGCTLAAGSGFTSRGAHQNDGAAYQALFEDKSGGSSGSTETATATAGGTATWGMLAVAYKIVGGGAAQFPLSRSVTQAQSLTLVNPRSLRRTLTALTQAQSLTITPLVTVTHPITRSVTQAQSLALGFTRALKRTLTGITQAQTASVATVVQAAAHYFLSGLATQAQNLSVALAQARLPINYYTTSFPLTENPINEGGVWTVGGRDAIDWTNPRTTPGKAFGTQTGADAAIYTDSIGVMKGTWGADQEVTLTVFNTIPGGDYDCEVEILLRFNVTPHSVTGTS